MAAKKRFKELTLEELQALITGLPKYCPNMTFMLAGKVLTTDQAVALLRTIVDAIDAVAAAKVALSAALDAESAVGEDAGKQAKELRQIVGLSLVDFPASLEALAISPRKPPARLSAEARLVASAKLRATRLARGTSSKKQKAKITGNVTGVIITPITTERKD